MSPGFINSKTWSTSLKNLRATEEKEVAESAWDRSQQRAQLSLLRDWGCQDGFSLHPECRFLGEGGALVFSSAFWF